MSSREDAPEEPERRSRSSETIAGQVARQYREANKPGIMPVTARRHRETFQNLLKLQIQEGRGTMDTDGESRKVLIRRFFDLSMTAQTDTGGPTVVRLRVDQKRAMEIIFGPGSKD